MFEHLPRIDDVEAVVGKGQIGAVVADEPAVLARAAGDFGRNLDIAAGVVCPGREGADDVEPAPVPAAQVEHLGRVRTAPCQRLGNHVLRARRARMVGGDGARDLLVFGAVDAHVQALLRCRSRAISRWPMSLR